MVAAAATRLGGQWLFEWPTHDRELIVDTVSVKTYMKLLSWITLPFEQEAETWAIKNPVSLRRNSLLSAGADEKTENQRKGTGKRDKRSFVRP